MASFGPFTISGEGSVQPNPAAAIAPTSIYIVGLTFPPRARFIGSIPPRGVYHVGGVGFGHIQGDQWGSSVSESYLWHFIQHEVDHWFIPTFQLGSFVAPSFYWSVVMGASFSVEIFF